MLLCEGMLTVMDIYKEDRLEKIEYEMKVSFSLYKDKKYIRFNTDAFVQPVIEKQVDVLCEELRKGFKYQDKLLAEVDIVVMNKKGGVLVGKKYINTE